MVRPAAPIVQGPITPYNAAVQVTGALAGATVTILADGTSVGSTIAGGFGSIWVPVSGTLAAKQLITATQADADGTSDPTSSGVPVLDVPNPLPNPVFASPLTVCTSYVWLDALTPGAKLTVTVGSKTVVSEVITRPKQLFRLDTNVPLNPGDQLKAQQRISTPAGTISSGSVPSAPIASIDGRLLEQLPAPVIGQPLSACDTALAFANMAAGGEVRVENEGSTTEWINAAQSYTGWGAPPLREGKVVARQSYERCERVSPEAHVLVGPAVAPSAPTVDAGYCPQTRRINVGNLSGSGTITVAREVQQAGGGIKVEDVVVQGFSNQIEQVDLPADMDTDADGNPTVSVRVRQTKCGLTSPSARIPYAAPGGPFLPPVVVTPVMVCSRWVRVHAAHQGSLVQVWLQKAGIPWSNPVTVSSGSMAIKTWWPLPAGEVITVKQIGCNANGNANDERVNDLPNPFPDPVIAEPVRPGAASVTLRKIVPGARVHLMVNGVVRSSIDSMDEETTMPVPAPPLSDGDRLWAIQSICAVNSHIEGHYVTVRRGDMKVSVSPATVTRGTTTMVTVSAADADTGQPIIGAQVKLNGVAVGVTGRPFAYAPKPGDPNPTGTVHEPVAHNDAAFPIQLIDKPKGRLSLQVGPTELVFNTLRITGATWQVTPLWNPGAAASVNGTLASLTLPDPPASGEQRVSVVLTATVEIAGMINGYAFPHQKWNVNSNPNLTLLHWSGTDLHAGFLALWNIVEDGYGNALVVVTPTFQGTNP